MVNAGLTSQPKVRCRRIEEADTDTVVALLTRGFAARRERPFWEGVMAHLARRAVPPDAPRFGLLLESEGKGVGTILQIFSTLPARAAGEHGSMRCNVSSWYVDPPFRSFAPFLVSQAIKQKGVTYLNVTSAPHTRKIVEAQGYVRYGNGVFVALPCLSRTRERVRIIAADQEPQAPCEAYEREVLKDHADSGCMSLWCETAERAYPFVFRERLVRGLVNCAQLIYCPDIADFVRFAAPLGRYLAWRRRPLVILDANGPIPGLVGRYFDDTMPRYFKGPVRPRLGDLAYTETAFFGV
jgi:hypothetical protein